MTEPLVPHDHDPATDGAGSGEAIMDKVTSAVDEFAKRAAPVVREVGAGPPRSPLPPASRPARWPTAWPTRPKTWASGWRARRVTWPAICAAT